MIVVCYKASGMKFVVAEGLDRRGFWEFYNRKKKAIEEQIEDEGLAEGELEIITGFPSLEFEIVDERLADGCDRYIARPDNWQRDQGEPA